MRIHEFVPHTVCITIFLIIVLCAVKLNNRVRRRNIEIRNIIDDYFLPLHCLWQGLQKIVP